MDLTALAGEEYCYLTTVGRVSGRPHTIEIWFAVPDADPRRMYLLSGGGDRSDWVRNLVAQPSVTVRIRDEEVRSCASLPAAEADEQLVARRLLAAKYQGWTEDRPLSGWATTALLVALDLGDG